MTYLHSLHDALVSINIANDRARAVVDAMERDLTTTLATKGDLIMLRQEMAGLATRADLVDVRQEVALLRKDVDSRLALMIRRAAPRSCSQPLPVVLSAFGKRRRLFVSPSTIPAGSQGGSRHDRRAYYRNQQRQHQEL